MASVEVFEELRPGLTRASYQILGSWADAEDIVQKFSAKQSCRGRRRAMSHTLTAGKHWKTKEMRT
jgi:hypothetical protein